MGTTHRRPDELRLDVLRRLSRLQEVAGQSDEDGVPGAPNGADLPSGDVLRRLARMQARVEAISFRRKGAT